MAYGGLCWAELNTGDPKSAAEFYGTLLGWSFTSHPDMPEGFSFIENAGEGIGDIEKLEGAGGSCWRGIIAVEDVDKTAAKAETLGGRIITPPLDIPGGFGRVAILADPSGAELAIHMTNGRGVPPTIHRDGVPGFMGWFELYTKDVDEAMAFYNALFGWEKEQDMDMGEAGVYRLFTVNGVQTGGMMKAMDMVPQPTWNLYFNCNSVEAAAERIKEAGGAVFMGPHEVPDDSWIIMAQDPQGVMFSLVSSGK
ncbi:VOC family protein [Emcibacter sp.]|uniref:VOC family protein n=1 Tax=Emcibacter sp. TaxID=1979954 RepID=UPI003A949AC1